MAVWNGIVKINGQTGSCFYKRGIKAINKVPHSGRSNF